MFELVGDVVGEHAEEHVRADAVFEVVVDRADLDRVLHRSERARTLRLAPVRAGNDESRPELMRRQLDDQAAGSLVPLQGGLQVLPVGIIHHKNKRDLTRREHILHAAHVR